MKSKIHEHKRNNVKMVSKKILYCFFILLSYNNICLGQTLMSDQDHRIMMMNYEMNLNIVLTAEIPQGITIDQFKEKIVNGELTLSSTAQASIIAYAAPLKAYGSDFAAAKGLNAPTDAYKYFFSSFTPSTLVENSKFIKDNNNSIMTTMEMWDCALGYFNTNSCGRTALVNNYTNLNKLATTCVDLIPQQVGEMGILMMVNGFSECMKVYLKPAIKFIPLEDVITADSDITQSLNNLISQTESNEYVIDSTSVTEMTYYTGRKSYSFTVVPRPDDNFFQNITIEKGDDNIVYNYLIEYSLNTNVEQMDSNKMGDYITETKIYPINTQLPTNYSTMQQRGILMMDCIDQGGYYQYTVIEGGEYDWSISTYYKAPDLFVKTYVRLPMKCTLGYFNIGPDIRPIGGVRGGGYTVPKTESNFYKFNTWINQSPTVKYWWDHVATPKIKKDIEIYSQYYGYSMDFSKQFVLQCMSSQFTLDFFPSLYSPYNVDTSTITDATPEGKKFNEIYEALTKQSPEFKKLFLAIFDENKSRFNVKFVMSDHVYKDDDPTKEEINGSCIYDGSPNLVIKINKQMFANNPTMSKTKIEIAKTIIHECIHAYLFVKVNNPNLGMDLTGLLNAQYPSASEQHDFMFDHMIPVMIKILSEIRNSITTKQERDAVEELTMHPTISPLTSTPWKWDDYFKFISLDGLHNTTCYENDFPVNSDARNFHAQYVLYGHNNLKP